jgi:hypothetical protein
MATRNSSGRKETELIDTISAGIHQLEAMLVITYGDPEGAFHSMSADLRDRYLWACHEKIAGVRQAWIELLDERLRKRDLLKSKGGAA